MASFAASYDRAAAPREIQANDGWVIRRKDKINTFRKVFARRATLGEAASFINRCHEASPSEWTIDGVSVPGAATVSEIHALLVKAGKIEA
jgi:hypothetical protein